MHDTTSSVEPISVEVVAAPHSPRQARFQSKIQSRKASLTDVEMAFLSALLVDSAAASRTSDREAAEQASKVLDDDMLFSVPKELVEKPKRPSVKRKPREYRFMVGLWQAHEHGVWPQKLLGSANSHKMAEQGLKPSKIIHGDDDDDDDCVEAKKDQCETAEKGDKDSKKTGAEEDDDGVSVSSDKEVRADAADDDSSDASWDEEDIRQFDAWQVLKDEYARENGFDYTPDGAPPSQDETELERNTFAILGTSADDQSAHPHVLSPPLMDALYNFVPDHLRGQNMWMKYSLVRDGASLDTFKQYARASKDTILAIETTAGQVFGCFVSQPWRTGPSFYGSAPSFVFKMRHGRNSPCHSLFEQAQMESEIDVFFLLEDGRRPQVCTSSMLGVGEDSLQHYDSYTGGDATIPEESDSEMEHENNYGFAIALTDDLLSGTTSKCSCYKNPCLVNPTSKQGEPFDVLNLELWSFTPCFSLDSAEKLEMTQFFVSESMRSVSMQSAASSSSDRFGSRDLDQNQFYRRVGHDDANAELRERWQYRNMMDGGNAASNRGIGSSPRFDNNHT